MKFLVVVFLSILAVSRGDEDESCSEARAEACVNNLLSSLLGDTTEGEVCGELRTSIDCLRAAVDECLGDERDEEVEEGLQELEKVLKDNCDKSEEEGESQESEESQENAEDEEEMAKCFTENEEYIYECIYEGTTQALTVLIERGEHDENTLKCAMYGMMAGCFVERVGEKCGDKAAQLAQDELADLPKEIEDACEAAGDIENHIFQLLDKKRK